jgi:hypothetical protein
MGSSDGLCEVLYVKFVNISVVVPEQYRLVFLELKEKRLR